MGFFASGGGGSSARPSGTPKVETLHRLQCRLCPLNNQSWLRNPHMEPTGSKRALVYMLGEAPGEQEDKRGRQFVGKSGELLRAFIPEEWNDRLRWNNVVRTRPPENRTPEFIEIECCRPSVVADIVATKPVAIFGFGNIPLEWVSTYTGIYKWRGRRMPVNVGGHKCWFYPMLHPSGLSRKRTEREKRSGRRFPLDKIATEDERAFHFDMKRAFREIDEGLPEPVVHNRAVAETGVEIITTFTDASVKRIEEVLMQMRLAKVVGVDYETKGIRPYPKGNKIITAAVSNGTLSFSFPLFHRKARWSPEQLKRILFLWVEFLFATPVKKAVHNLAFEMEWSAVNFDVALLRSSNWEDTMQQAVILDERVGGKPGCLKLDFLVQQYFGFGLKDLSKLDLANLESEPLDVVLTYNAMDAKYHRGLYFAQKQRLKEEGLLVNYQSALRRVPTCVLTQMKGVPRDQAIAQKLADKYNERIEQLKGEISELPIVKKFEKRYHKKYNPLSDDQCAKMFRDLQGRTDGFTKSEGRRDGFVADHPSQAGFSTDKAVLKAIGTPLALKTIELREATKRKSTYLDPLLEGAKTVYPDGLLHPTLNTAFSEPGRTSSEGPNVQNYPKRDGEAKEVRKPIRAPDGEVFVAFDQGQIQARIIAMASKDKTFTQSLWERYDVHAEWADRIALAYPSRVGGRQNLKDWKLGKDSKMKEFRGDVKNQWTFPLFFGAQISSVAEYLSIPEEVAKKLVEEFWKQFHGVKDWHERLQKFYYKHGYVELLTGRRCRAPLSFNEMINYPIQGTEAEIVLDCQSRISEMESNLWDRSLDRVDMPKSFQRLASNGTLMFQPSLMIHDDLTYRFPVKDVDKYAEIIIPEMLKKTFPFINVPLTVEMSVGKSWYAMEEVEKFSSDEWFRKGEGGW